MVFVLIMIEKCKMNVNLFILVTVTSFILLSCLEDGEMQVINLSSGGSKPVSGEIRYLALGDSYTIGESVPAEQRWPVQLQKKLVAEGIKAASPEIIARTGWTTSELAEGIRVTNPKGPYQLVTLLIGVNNQYRGLDTAEYRRQFRELLVQAATFAGNDYSRVIVVSIPDYGYTPFGQSRERSEISRAIDRFNGINEQETRKTPAVYINITVISRNGIAEPQLVASDGLHPSGEQYRRWVELIFPVAKSILNK
jgi:lysophospholipase L1-like esterase